MHKMHTTRTHIQPRVISTPPRGQLLVTRFFSVTPYRLLLFMTFTRVLCPLCGWHSDSVAIGHTCQLLTICRRMRSMLELRLPKANNFVVGGQLEGWGKDC